MARRQNTMFGCIILALISWPVFQNSDSTAIQVIFSTLFSIGAIGAIGGAFSSDKDFE